MRLRVLENSARSVIERYCLFVNFFSSCTSWVVVNGVRGFLFDLCFLSVHLPGGIGWLVRELPTMQKQSVSKLQTYCSRIMQIWGHQYNCHYELGSSNVSSFPSIKYTNSMMSNLKRMSSFKLEKTIENYILFINQSINHSIWVYLAHPRRRNFT